VIKEIEMTANKNLEGLGGWLVLVGIGVILSPLIIIATVFPAYSQMFSNGSWDALTTPGSAAYSSLWAPLIVGEITINVGLVVAWVFAAVLFFSKKAGFPKLYIGIVLFSLAFIIFDAVAIKSVLPDEPIFNSETAKQIARALVSALIWIPYMLRSKRVSATFTR
jgi:hypothetical protein